MFLFSSFSSVKKCEQIFSVTSTHSYKSPTTEPLCSAFTTTSLPRYLTRTRRCRLVWSRVTLPRQTLWYVSCDQKAHKNIHKNYELLLSSTRLRPFVKTTNHLIYYFNTEWIDSSQFLCTFILSTVTAKRMLDVMFDTRLNELDHVGVDRGCSHVVNGYRCVNLTFLTCIHIVVSRRDANCSVHMISFV